jgi:hypothetical protein
MSVHPFERCTVCNIPPHNKHFPNAVTKADHENGRKHREVVAGTRWCCPMCGIWSTQRKKEDHYAGQGHIRRMQQIMACAFRERRAQGAHTHAFNTCDRAHPPGWELKRLAKRRGSEGSAPLSADEYGEMVNNSSKDKRAKCEVREKKSSIHRLDPPPVIGSVQGPDGGRRHYCLPAAATHAAATTTTSLIDSDEDENDCVLVDDCIFVETAHPSSTTTTTTTNTTTTTTPPPIMADSAAAVRQNYKDFLDGVPESKRSATEYETRFLLFLTGRVTAHKGNFAPYTAIRVAHLKMGLEFNWEIARQVLDSNTNYGDEDAILTYVEKKESDHSDDHDLEAGAGGDESASLHLVLRIGSTGRRLCTPGFRCTGYRSPSRQRGRNSIPAYY